MIITINPIFAKSLIVPLLFISEIEQLTNLFFCINKLYELRSWKFEKTVKQTVSRVHANASFGGCVVAPDSSFDLEAVWEFENLSQSIWIRNS